MKKILLSMALVAATTGAFAQNRLVKKAQGLVNQEKIDEAQAVLTEALNSGETKNMGLAGRYLSAYICSGTEQGGCSHAVGYNEVCH